MAKPKKQLINFGEFCDYVSIGKEAKECHELLDEEKKLLIDDFRKVKKIEKEENIEEKAIKHFEQKLQELLQTVVYLEGYIAQIEEGNQMLKHSPSVQKLGEKLNKGIEEIEALSESLLEKERKIMELAKHISKALGKAKKFQEAIMGE